tara:strand:+ start:623 stop:772 length:150 start_codon:yes stop_codon:yes gene_type:complete
VKKKNRNAEGYTDEYGEQVVFANRKAARRARKITVAIFLTEEELSVSDK